MLPPVTPISGAHKVRRTEIAVAITLISMVLLLLGGIFLHDGTTTAPIVDRVTELTARLDRLGIHLNANADINNLVSTACGMDEDQMPWTIAAMQDRGVPLGLTATLIELWCPSHLPDWETAVRAATS
jgi:hypothetical protein